MTETIGDTDTWPYCGTVSLRPVGEISQFLQYCSCQMKDWLMHTEEGSFTTSAKPRVRRAALFCMCPEPVVNSTKKNVATIEDSGSKWVLIQAAKELKKATKQ